jgi:hypothetical protein
MAIYEQINVGSAPGAGDGATVRDAYTIVNDNFTLREVLLINAQVGVAYGPLITDANGMITMDNAGANIITIPANASVAYPIGTQLHFMQLGAGQTTIAITSDTLNVAATQALTLREQFVPATAYKDTATSWTLFGNLTVI